MLSERRVYHNQDSRISTKHSAHSSDGTSIRQEIDDIQLAQPDGIVLYTLAPGLVFRVAMSLSISLDTLPHAPHAIVQRDKIRGSCVSVHLLSADQAAGGIANLCSGTSDDGDGLVAMYVHPEQDHHGEEVTKMQRGSGRIYARIGADGLVGEQFVEGIAVACQILDITTLFQYRQQALSVAGACLLSLFVP